MVGRRRGVSSAGLEAQLYGRQDACRYLGCGFAALRLYGGFQGSETNLQQRNWTANLAILDGGSFGSVVTASHLSSWCAIDGSCPT